MGLTDSAGPICLRRFLPLVAHQNTTTYSSRTMAFRSAAEEMDRLQLSDEDTEDLWDSPSKRGNKNVNVKPKIPHDDGSPSPEPRASNDDGKTVFDRQESRETALRNELQSVRNINDVIEGLLSSLDQAKGNMDVCYSFLDLNSRDREQN